uniref:Cilia- and flagella-associated protein 157 n=1 Tax=Cafeteria roenbergensis TaxID=33653 RepID=A0A7S0PG42_CAFRO|mmetsp:Transcript_7067/g.28595  ORF Transcript_7067/g.28595 Transcript_7067/m.28595 type:complete len:481 (+) Transcript_7067:161-1603(+)
MADGAAAGKADGAGAFRLTAINDEGDRVVAEPESMGRVRELHEQLSDVVVTLNSKVSRVLHKQEQEFLSAYRGHMYSVQRELQTWKDKADAARLRQERDQRMQRLTEECAWFRKEALRLNKFTTALKRDVTALRERLGAVEEDRQWLSRQLKAAKKDNKLLRAELELRMTEPSAASLPAPLDGADESGRGGGGDHRGFFAGGGAATLPPLGARERADQGPASRGPFITLGEDVDGGMAGSSGMLEQAGDFASPLGHARRPGGPGEGVAAGGSARGGQAGAPSAGTVARLEAQVARLTAQLSAERTKTRRQRVAAEAESSERRALQAVLAECVSEVRRQERKRRAAGGSGAGGAGAAASRRAGAARGAAASDLDGSDKRLVVQRLLSDDLVLEALHRTIFGSPREAEEVGDAGDGGDGGGHSDGPLRSPGGRGAARAGSRAESKADGGAVARGAASGRSGVVRTRVALGSAVGPFDGVPGT